MLIQPVVLLIFLEAFRSEMSVDALQRETNVKSLQREQTLVGVAGKGNSTQAIYTSDRPPKKKRAEKARRKARYKVRLHLPDVKMAQILNDRGSTRHQELVRTLTNDIQQLFTNTAGDQKVSNLRFSSYEGSSTEHPNINEQNSWREDIAVAPQSSDLIPSQFVLPTPRSPKLSSSTMSRQQKHFKEPVSTLSSTTVLSLVSLTSQSSVRKATQKARNRPRSTSSTTGAKTTGTTSTATTSPGSTTTGIKSTGSRTRRTTNTGIKTTGSIIEGIKTTDSTLKGIKATGSRITRTTTTARTTTSTKSTTTPRTTVSRTTKTKTTTPTTTATTSQPTTQSSSGKFNVGLITRLFKDSYTLSHGSRDYLILLEPYLDGYTELLTIFKILGPIFSFAADDASGKLAILRRLRQEDLKMNQNNYATFQSMFAYEYSPEGADAEQEGVSNNKWIHRPLKLISGIIGVALNASNDANLGAEVRELYSNTLAPYHDWYVRMAVYVALLSFPSRPTLMQEIGMADSPESRQAFSDLISAIDAVYEDIDKLYLKYSPSD